MEVLAIDLEGTKLERQIVVSKVYPQIEIKRVEKIIIQVTMLIIV